MDSLGNIPEVHSISDLLDYAIPVIMAPSEHLEDPDHHLPPESGWMVLDHTGHWTHDPRESRESNGISERHFYLIKSAVLRVQRSLFYPCLTSASVFLVTTDEPLMMKRTIPAPWRTTLTTLGL